MYYIRLTPKVPREDMLPEKNIPQYKALMGRLFNGALHSQSKKRPFLYRVDRQHIDIYAQEKPIFPKDFGWDYLIKDFNPVLNHNDSLIFRLFFNPTCTENRDHIGYVNTKRRTFHVAKIKVTQADIYHEAAMDWFNDHQERLGFQIENLQVIRFKWIDFQYENAGKTRHPRFESLDVMGTLRVVNPEKFVSALFNGIGREKSYGLGMLQIKRS